MHRFVELSVSRLGHVGNHILGEGTEDVVLLGTFARNPLTVDEVFVL